MDETPRRNRRLHPVDIHVGSRVRLARTLIGMSQDALGKRVGLTFQQVQKYERGTNRVSASCLWDLAQVLGVNPAFFFNEMAGTSDADPENADLNRREILEVAKAYTRIENARIRAGILELLRSISSDD